MKELVLIGNPVAHSLSPVMHNSALEFLGLDKDFNYGKLNMEKKDLQSFVDSLRDGKFHGANVTIPHKVEIMKYVDGLTKEAQLIGAVNTLFRKGEKVIGHNTDGIGCLRALNENGVKVKGKRVLLVGAGGGARAIGITLGLNFAKEVNVVNRSLEKAKQLSLDIKEKTDTSSSYGDLEGITDFTKKVDILINCTPVGMKGKFENESVVDKDSLEENLTVMDIVYNPLETKLLKEARDLGCTVIGGLDMLLYQGVEGFEIWTGEDAPVENMRAALKEKLE